MTPEMPVKRDRSIAAGIALIALVLLLAVAGASGGAGLLGIDLTAGDSVARIATVTGSQEAVKDVIRRANEAQVTAFNSVDPGALKANATAGHYARLVEIDRDLRASGVTRIELLALDWGEVRVDGTSAAATTFETWRSTYQDGSIGEETARNEYGLVLDGSVWKVDSNEQPAVVRDPAPERTETGTPAAARTFSTSSNWSGYAATGGTFTSVTGRWIVPSVSATTPGADATWVGIGGITTTDLIQAGTQATVSDGAVAYNAWIELLPAPSRPIPLTVGAGDSVTVTITQKSTLEWTITLANDTTGGRYATTVQYRSSGSSAEWVQEAPSSGRGVVPLDAFGVVRVSAAAAVRDGRTMDLRSLGAEAITMINAGRQALASPSVIGDDGASFTVTRTAAESTPTAGGQRRRRG